MGRRNLLQSSTYPDITGAWWRARISDLDLKWARINLVSAGTAPCLLEKSEACLRGDGPPRRTQTLPADFERRVYFEKGKPYPWVLIQLGEQYRIRELSNIARLKNDPELAPHLSFRKLKCGNTAVALGFLKEFGPLFRSDMVPSPVYWVDLNDFWLKQRRLTAMVRLFESISDREALRLAMIDVLQNERELNSVGPANLGMLPQMHDGMEFVRVAYLLGKTDEALAENPRNPDAEQQRLRENARELIGAELTLQTNGGIGSTWLPEEDSEGFIRFRPERVVLSLWAGMWEMFGLATWTGLSWRACRICGKYFYPLQRNSECCTPQHQALWSKRMYAQRKRYEAMRPQTDVEEG